MGLVSNQYKHYNKSLLLITVNEYRDQTYFVRWNFLENGRWSYKKDRFIKCLCTNYSVLFYITCIMFTSGRMPSTWVQSTLSYRPSLNIDHPEITRIDPYPWRYKINEPGNKDHLSTKTDFLLSQQWPLFTGVTVSGRYKQVNCLLWRLC